MPVQLDHTIVPVRDGRESATFVAEVLGLAPPYRAGSFHVVEVANGVNLDFADLPADEEPRGGHYAFLVTEEEFDEIHARLEGRGVPYWADPHATRPGEVADRHGGRALYFPEPGGHYLEITTRSSR